MRDRARGRKTKIEWKKVKKKKKTGERERTWID